MAISRASPLPHRHAHRRLAAAPFRGPCGRGCDEPCDLLQAGFAGAAAIGSQHGDAVVDDAAVRVRQRLLQQL